MDKTIDMARESWLDTYGLGKDHNSFVEALKRFEALVRADEAEKYKWDVHSCGPTCTRVACVALREAVQSEREACAQVVEEYPHWLGMTAKAEIANAIRANQKQAHAAQATARVAIAHLQAVLNKARTHAEQQAADTAARDWLISIGSEPT
jgi:hypothetical protein